MRTPVTTAALILALFSVSLSPAAGADEGDDPALADKLRAVRDVAHDFTENPQGIPEDVLKRARGVLIFSNVIQAGFLVSGNFGRGVALLKDVDGKWSQPAFFRISGAGFGLLAGGQVSDVVVVVNSAQALDALLDHHFTMGVDFDATAGTVGGGVQASGNTRAAVVSYARSHGLFAGVSLDGSVIKEDAESNRRYYGQPLTARDILIGNKAPSTGPGEELIKSLETGLFKNS